MFVEAPKTVYMFPGQGIQKPGMNRELFALRIGTVEEMYRHANELLRDEFGWSVELRDLTLNGPQELLDQTEYAQPALFVASATRYNYLANGKLLTAAVTGHSLGEYAALYAAGSLEFLDALRLVSKRGRLMALAGTLKQGGMAVVNLSEKDAEALCAQVRGDRDDVIIVPANINGIKQTVISGDTEAVTQAVSLAEQFNAKVINLPVSIAAHSPHMESAKEGMTNALAAVTIQYPRMNVYSPTTAGLLEDPDAIRAAFVAQLTGRVLWLQTVKTLKENGTFMFVEVGPGEVLTGLVRKFDKDHHKATWRVGPTVYPMTFIQH